MLAYHFKSSTPESKSSTPKSTGLAWAFCLILAAGCVVAGPCPAQTAGQQGTGTVGKSDSLLDRRVSINAEEASLTGVLKTLMQGVGADYTLAPELRGVTVTAHLTNLPLGIALETLLKAGSAPATYHIENGVYFFVLRTEASSAIEVGQSKTPAADTGAGIIRRVRVNYIDASDLARLLGGMAIKIYGQSYGVVNPNASSLFGPRGGAGASAGPNGGNLQGSLFDGSLVLIGNVGAGFP